MFPNIESTSQGTSASTTDHVVTLPTGIVEGDFLVVFLGLDSASSPTASGWTAITLGSTSQARFFTRVADGTEGSTVTFSSGSASASGYFAFRISGASGVYKRSAYNILTASSDTINVASVSTNPQWWNTNNLFIAYAFVYNNRTYSDFPAGYTGGMQDNIGTTRSHAVAYLQTESLTEGGGTFTMTVASTNRFAGTIVIQPQNTGNFLAFM
jgi:hypothetical protein